MSFALPSVKAKPAQPADFGFSEGYFGVPDVMTYGLASCRNDVDIPHPMMLSESTHASNQSEMNMSVLRNTQGLHGPMRIAMELKAAKKVGRLPFLQSSNIMHDCLTGRDIELDPSDVFNVPEMMEVTGIPHAVVEKSLGIL